MDIKELKEKPNSELRKLLIQQKEALLKQRFAHAQGDLANPHSIHKVRRTIARILTILNQQKTHKTNN